jgi:hypothetical protein
MSRIESGMRPSARGNVPFGTGIVPRTTYDAGVGTVICSVATTSPPVAEFDVAPDVSMKGP